MFKKYNYGDRLVLQLSNKDVLSGSYVKSTDNRIDLKNLSDQDGRILDGTMSFYTNEVISIRKINKENEDDGSPVANGSLPVVYDEGQLLIPEGEFERLKQMTQNHTFIHQKDKEYHDACNDLMCSESVGVVGLGCSLGRNSKLSLLVLSNWQHVYIFDIQDCPGISFYSDLKQILQSKYIVKVIHDGRAVVDCLYHVHKVKMNNVFDTFVADVTLKKRENGKYVEEVRNISKCLVDYFNFPEYLLYGALNVKEKMWKKRPLDYEMKTKAALLGTYLLTLKDHMQSKLLETYFNSVRSVYASCVNLNAYELNEKISDKKFTSELDSLIPKLEKDLKT